MWKSLIDTMYSFSVNFNHVERIRLLYKAKNTTAKKNLIGKSELAVLNKKSIILKTLRKKRRKSTVNISYKNAYSQIKKK